MRQARKGLVASALFLLALLTVVPFTISSSAATSELCSDNVSQPVLQDKDWHLIDPSMNYSDYTLQYVEPFVMKQGADFVMYVRELVNSSSAIYRGTSLDGVSWTFGAFPVLQTGPNGSWDSAVVFSPDVMWNGTGYMMYYVGSGATTAQFRQIGVAFSADGTHWTKYTGNPVITHGPGSYDARYTRAPSVAFENGSYKMWYWGTSQINSTIPLQASIDYATSPDGLHWTKSSSNPVFLGFHYSDNSTSSEMPSVIAVNGTYLMAFSSYTGALGLAASTDGINWRFDNQTGLMLATSGWHNGFVYNPTIAVSGDKLLLWYDGYDNHTTTIPLAPYVAGIGFASCGTVLSLPQITTTISTTVTTTATSTSISRSITTVIMTTTKVTTQTVLQNSNASTFEVALAAVIGASIALLASILVILKRLRSARA